MAKVTGTAPYAFEHDVSNPAYMHPLQATIARGSISEIDPSEIESSPGVLSILTHRNAPRLGSDANPELWILQDADVAFRGQIIGGVIADSAETAREAARLVHHPALIAVALSGAHAVVAAAVAGKRAL